MEEGTFRNDLMFRLNVIPIYLPPLRARGDDVRLLTQHFVDAFAQEFRKPIHRIEEEAYVKLAGYSWPGNVRELRNVLERAALLCKGDTIGPDDVVVGRVDSAGAALDLGHITLPSAGLDLRELESKLIREAMSRTNNNQTQAAKLLKLSRDALRSRLEKLGMV